LRNVAYKGVTYAFSQLRDVSEDRLRSGLSVKRVRTVIRPREEWVEIPGATPTIVSTELFDAVQEQLDRNRRRCVGKVKREYLLRGLVLCGECGGRYRGKTRGKNSYYVCGHGDRIVKPVPCNNVRVPAGRLEGIVWGEVEKILSSPEVVFHFLERRQREGKSCEYWEVKLAEVGARLGALSKREERLLIAYEFGLEREQVSGRKAALDKEREVLLSEKAQYERQLAVAQEMRVDFDGVRAACERVRSRLGWVTQRDKRLALEALNVQVVVGRESLTFRGVLPVIGDMVSPISRCQHRAGHSPH